jgi:hypothetical protein
MTCCASASARSRTRPRSGPYSSTACNPAGGTANKCARSVDAKGLLVGYDVDDVAIARHDTRLGDTVVHLPRLGYTLSER